LTLWRLLFCRCSCGQIWLYLSRPPWQAYVPLHNLLRGYWSCSHRTIQVFYYTGPHPFHFLKLDHKIPSLHCWLGPNLLASHPSSYSPFCSLGPVPTSLYPDNLPPYLPETANFMEPFAIIGASHANDLWTKHSTTGYAFIMYGAVIAYCVKTQPIMATSSTQAEFFAAVQSGKVCRYLCFILCELDFPIPKPTILFKDNNSTIQIINHGKPTERTCHVDIQWFAIQEWQQAGDLVLHHLPGKINPADALPKPLRCILHERHCRRLLGHFSYCHHHPSLLWVYFFLFYPSLELLHLHTAHLVLSISSHINFWYVMGRMSSSQSIELSGSSPCNSLNSSSLVENTLKST
jgi:hypothetical protein